jgi:hypothetical protein
MEYNNPLHKPLTTAQISQASSLRGAIGEHSARWIAEHFVNSPNNPLPLPQQAQHHREMLQLLVLLQPLPHCTLPTHKLHPPPRLALPIMTQIRTMLHELARPAPDGSESRPRTTLAQSPARSRFAKTTRICLSAFSQRISCSKSRHNASILIKTCISVVPGLSLIKYCFRNLM